MEERTFREACCEKLGISPTGFEEAVLWRCIPAQRLWLARLFWRVSHSYFNDDLEIIRAVADCTSVSDLRVEFLDQRHQKPNQGFLRGALRTRLSGRYLVDFACLMFSRDVVGAPGGRRSRSLVNAPGEAASTL